MPNVPIKLSRPQISVDRDSCKIAVFDNFECVRDFVPFADEATAVDEAKAWVKERSDVEPEMIYPRITRMVMSYSRPRRRRK